jgi:hypothetical protein
MRATSCLRAKRARAHATTIPIPNDRSEAVAASSESDDRAKSGLAGRKRAI